MLIEGAPLQVRHRKRDAPCWRLRLDRQCGAGHGCQACLEGTMTFCSGASLTVRQAGTLFGIPAQQLDLEARLVIPRACQRGQRHLGTTKDCLPLALEVNDHHDPEAPLQLAMGHDRLRESRLLVRGRHAVPPCQGGEGHCAVVELRATASSAAWVGREIAQSGIHPSLPNHVEAEVTHAIHTLLLPTVAVYTKILPRLPGVCRDHAREMLHLPIKPALRRVCPGGRWGLFHTKGIGGVGCHLDPGQPPNLQALLRPTGRPRSRPDPTQRSCAHSGAQSWDQTPTHARALRAPPA